MGTLVFFPTDRYGSVTRATEQPHPVERLAAWLRKVAHIRASASLGCEATLELAPNIVPLARHFTKDEAMARSVRDYCNMRGYSRTICKDAIRVGIMRIREGKSVATAIASAKVRADFAHQHTGNAYMGLFQVEGHDGFVTTHDVKRMDVWCENFNANCPEAAPR